MLCCGSISRSLNRQSKILVKKFKEKKYPKALVEDAYARTVGLTQESCIKPKIIKKEDNKYNNHNNFKSAFITQYCQNHRTINNIMNKHWHLLKEDPYLNKSITTKPCIIHRRARTLKSVLAPSHFKNKNITNKNDDHPTIEIKNGSFKCHHSRCKCCLNINDKIDIIQSSTTNKMFNIKSHMDCGSSFIIYLIQCKCGLQYVGRTTQTLRMRVNNHRHNVTNGYLKHSLSRHALTKHNCDFRDFSITPIEKIDETVRNKMEILSRREMYWIYQLHTLVPHGLNESLDKVF